MASKLQMVTEFSYHKTLELSSVRGNWQRYLKTAARIYKYPFRDQLLIHAQRPAATACRGTVLRDNLGRETFDGALAPWEAVLLE